MTRKRMRMKMMDLMEMMSCKNFLSIMKLKDTE